MSDTHCEQCGQAFKSCMGGFLPGYAVERATEKKICYSCATEKERQWMIERGRTTLYIFWHSTPVPPDMRRPESVGNWTGDLKFQLRDYRHLNRHNWGGRRIDVWFRGPDGCIWWGWHTGDNDLIHCRRTKRRDL